MFQLKPLHVLMSAALLAAAGSAQAANSSNSFFGNFTPLATSAGPTVNEAKPITLSSPNFSQVSIADRTTQLALFTR